MDQLVVRLLAHQCPPEDFDGSERHWRIPVAGKHAEQLDPARLVLAERAVVGDAAVRDDLPPSRARDGSPAAADADAGHVGHRPKRLKIVERAFFDKGGSECLLASRRVSTHSRSCSVGRSPRIFSMVALTVS